MPDSTYQPGVYRKQGGNELVVASGGKITVESGGGVDLGGGTPKRIVWGQSTTVAASDTIVTGLGTLVAVIACLNDDPSDDPEWVSASIGDQVGAPAAGSFLLKTWKNTGGTDPTPAAATTFSKKVNWIAIGA